jgi:hypothetical protein
VLHVGETDEKKKKKKKNPVTGLSSCSLPDYRSRYSSGNVVFRLGMSEN